MIISIASGKGGTGKTTVAASLASVIPESVYIDCDVEEPNGHLLLNPEFNSEKRVEKFLPNIDQDKCTFCGKCVDVCEFNALINLKFEILLFEEMCHSCGACIYFCPSTVIAYKSKEIGLVRCGITKDKIQFAEGILKIGEATAVPLIREVKKKSDPSKINIIDSPPGTSCSMIETVKDSDFCVLVTESTPFGLSDLKLAIDVLRSMEIPFGVVINKYDPCFTELENYLVEENVKILLKIPFDKKYAEAYSGGTLPIRKYPDFEKDFKALSEMILRKMESANVG